MNLPFPQFVGFFPKLTLPRPEWLNVATVEVIGSVSLCMSRGPENWLTHWKHNALGFYDSEARGLSVIAGPVDPFDLYAYELFPLIALDGAVEPEPLEVEPEPLPLDFEFLGYDIVTKSVSHFFECSPLSCNHAASDYAVNAYCLIDNETDAYNAMLEMSKPGSGVEPGPYFLFKVYRKRRV